MGLGEHKLGNLPYKWHDSVQFSPNNSHLTILTRQFSPNNSNLLTPQLSLDNPYPTFLTQQFAPNNNNLTILARQISPNNPYRSILTQTFSLGNSHITIPTQNFSFIKSKYFNSVAGAWLNVRVALWIPVTLKISDFVSPNRWIISDSR